MEANTRRYLTFIALALPFVLLQMMVTRKQQTQRRAAEQAAQESIVTTPTAEPTEQAPGQQTEMQPGIPAPPPLLSSARPDDIKYVDIATDSQEIRFSTYGAVPVDWKIIDPRVRSEGSGAGSSEFDDALESYDDSRIPLIDADLDVNNLSRPLEILLREKDGEWLNRQFNERVYTYKKTEDLNAITLVFESPRTNLGLRLIKTYRFPRQGFTCSLTIRLINDGASNLTFSNRGWGLGVALGPGLGYAPDQAGGFGSYLSRTQSIYKDAEGVQKIKIKADLGWESESEAGFEWVGLTNQYFMMSLVPERGFELGRAARGEAPTQGFIAIKAQLDSDVALASLASEKTLVHYPRIEVYGPRFDLRPGEDREFALTIFAGPKDWDILKASGPGLQSVMFHGMWWGWMRGLCILMLKSLGWFHGLFNNWGWAIIGLVIAVRLITFPIAQIGLKSQAKMMAQQAKLKPDLDRINAKYKDNPTKKNQEVMKVYREHNVNPLGMLKGCGWMFIQLPIFIALYRLLGQAFDLRGADFLWIDDLSQPDRLFAFGVTLPLLGAYFNLLPVLTSATQMLVSKLSMNPNAASDPSQAAIQKQMMYMMPVMILVMTYQFPSGLVLYWFVSNLWQLVQQRFVNKKILHPATPPAAPVPKPA